MVSIQDQTAHFVQSDLESTPCAKDGERVNPLHHTIQSFNDPETDGFEKILWEQEKMLVTNIVSFPTRFSSHPATNSNNAVPFILLGTCSRTEMDAI